MTTTTVAANPDLRAALDPNSLSRVAFDTGSVESWLELESRCRVPVLDRERLREAVRSLPVPRSVGQYRYSHPGIGTWNGRTATLTGAAGLVSLGVSDITRDDRRLERLRTSLVARAGVGENENHQQSVTYAGRTRLGRVVDSTVYSWETPTPRRVITEWSRKSRTRMLKAFASVDFAPLAESGNPAGMVTLTLPGDWIAVAPTGKAFKQLMRRLQLRYKRATGSPLVGAWKMEFQRRGAPHLHVLMAVPAIVKGQTFERWLALTWADIVSADHCGCVLDPDGRDGCCERARHVHAGTGVDFATTARSSDPKRLGIYFMKHSTKASDGKEYQHDVPAEWLVDAEGELDPTKGAGRFWGFWGLKTATEARELDVDDFFVARRRLRAVARASARRVSYQRARAAGVSPAGALRMRRPKVAAFNSSRMVGGFVIVNDGPRLVGDLARAVNLARLQRV